MSRRHRSTRGNAVRALAVGVTLLLPVAAAGWHREEYRLAAAPDDADGSPAIWPVGHTLVVIGPRPRVLLAASRLAAAARWAAGIASAAEAMAAAASARSFLLASPARRLLSPASGAWAESRAPPPSVVP